MFRTVLAALALVAISALPGSTQTAQGTAVRAEILPGWQRADGTRIAAIRLTMAPGWKTYWRAPGEAGIPPQFDWSGSDNLGGIGISWPAPHVFDQNGMRSIGYKDEVVLPLTIAPRRKGQPVRLEAELDIGVCRDICVPERLRLGALLDATGTTPTPAIAAALAARPYGAGEAGVKGATCTLRPGAGGMQIETRVTMPPAGGEEFVVIEPGRPGLWVGETQTRRSGSELVATGPLEGLRGGVALDRSAITITVLGESRAVEISGCRPG
jgi:DsbC/DsbD-like thiol-disulfide interchange protein